jgi:hypothetical protein
VSRQYHFDALGSTLGLTDDNQQLTRAHFKTVQGRRSSRPVVRIHETGERDIRTV